MIYTLTLNPSIDYHITLPAFTEGGLNRVQKERKTAGGKGINVSLVLKKLGMESLALGFTGGFTGRFIEGELLEAGIHTEFLRIGEDSRINIKLHAEKETELTGVSPRIPREKLDALLLRLSRLTNKDTLVLSGGVPGSLDQGIYGTIMKRLQVKGVRIFLDASGAALEKALEERPFLIKPNQQEVSDLFGVPIETAEEAITYARKLLPLGPENVIVSLGGEGAVLVNHHEAFIARIPRSKPINTIGAGDSMVAGFLYQYVRQEDVESAFRFAVAAGSATALSEGFCTPESIEAFLPHIILKKGENT
ncbi:1-phosphofructokinase [Aneurinibacillus sp. Ricciae_BoGa-3]|uniref:1-phosphofructokinase n=1 Tax=Aneurinibacillus sp. Ricciae_BoGa-3 TaxID=3022697 RepID=UPI002341914A|nr:1-phosphofructokinase [Aneurinibacillus sp. Ricciae_BoGa-3]WCK55279.1 1-phosphofructokinase [Aneurinibacillus sp. Ricciae_BoGa-3]